MYDKTIVSLEKHKENLKKNIPTSMAQTTRDTRRLGSLSLSLPSNTQPVVYYLYYNLYVQ